MYDPKQYWEERGKDYRASNPTWEEESKTLRGYYLFLNDFTPHTTLEVGSGYGRIYELLGHPMLMDMCDISTTMAEKCMEITQRIVYNWDGITLPFKDNSYDLVISYSVLLHVPPDQIRNHISELLRVGKEVYIATYSGIQSGEHYFAHDYLELFKQLEAELVSCKTFGENRVHYVVRK